MPRIENLEMILEIMIEILIEISKNLDKLCPTLRIKF